MVLMECNQCTRNQSAKNEVIARFMSLRHKTCSSTNIVEIARTNVKYERTHSKVIILGMNNT